MMSAPKAIQKLRRPPSAHNWVRNIRPRRDDTAFALRNFALHGPRHSLKPVQDIIKQIVVDGISLGQALKCLEPVSDPLVRQLGVHIINAFHPYSVKHDWRGIEVFHDLTEFYRVAANVHVPVKPTFVLNIDGKLVPHFVICWTQIGLSPYQKRVLSTLITDAILTLEEFQGSDAVIVCTPKHRFSKFQRQIVEWKVSDHPALNEHEKQQLFDRYAGALVDAERMIIESLG